MKPGDKVFYYHSRRREGGGGRERGGAARPIPIPPTRRGKFVAVDLKADKPLKRPVTLAEIKADPAFANMVLVKNSRLSVQPVTTDEWKQDQRHGELLTWPVHRTISAPSASA